MANSADDVGTATSEPAVAPAADLRAAGLSDQVHSLQRFTMRAIRRESIQNADYNPRVISEGARKKLGEGLKKLGLLQPLVWNETTGNLVGGHQRLAILDKLVGKGSSSYMLQVAAVKLTPVEEREANILLNNPEAMGEWDLGKLDALLRTDGLRLEATGFDMGDIYRTLGDSPFALEHGEELQQLAADQQATTDAIDAVHKAIGANHDGENFYLVVVFKDDVSMTEFIDTLELRPNIFQDGRTLMDMLVPLKKQRQAQLDAEALADATFTQSLSPLDRPAEVDEEQFAVQPQVQEPRDDDGERRAEVAAFFGGMTLDDEGDEGDEAESDDNADDDDEEGDHAPAADA
jgi:hypothetical protein